MNFDAATAAANDRATAKCKDYCWSNTQSLKLKTFLSTVLQFASFHQCEFIWSSTLQLVHVTRRVVVLQFKFNRWFILEFSFPGWTTQNWWNGTVLENSVYMYSWVVTYVINLVCPGIWFNAFYLQKEGDCVKLVLECIMSAESPRRFVRPPGNAVRPQPAR